MKDYREMIVVAIGISEDMWRRNRPHDVAQQEK